MSDFGRVKQAVDIAEVVGRHVSLKRQGRRLLGLCPFHAEKTPSFHVLPDDQYFYCHGCQKGGDVFVFLQEMLQIEAAEALRMLAEESGVELTRRGGRGADDRDRTVRLRAAMADAVRLFRDHAAERRTVFESFLAARRVELETADRFALGLAPAGYRLLTDRLVARGYELALLEEAGLGRSRPQGFVDAFRDRLVIPIRDEHGRTVAFGARRLRDGEGAPDPKYLNSKDSPLFHKGKLLYALDLAREAVRLEDRVVLVEGYLDVILAHQAGLRSCVAALGTAVTADHAVRIRRLASTVVLFLDGDKAGRRAARRAVPILLQAGLKVRVFALEEGDPGDYFASGRKLADFEADLERSARTGLDHLLEEAGAFAAETAEERTAAARSLLEDLEPVTDPLIRLPLLQDLGMVLHLPLEALEQASQARRPGVGARRPATAGGPAKAASVGPGKLEPSGGDSPRVLSAPADEAEQTERGGLLPRSRHGVAEIEVLEAMLRDGGLRELARELPEIIAEGTFRHPVRLRLFRGLMAAGTTGVGALLDLFPGDSRTQRLIQHLAFRSSETDPGRLFDGAVLYFQQERNNEKGRRLKEDYKLEQRGVRRPGGVRSERVSLGTGAVRPATERPSVQDRSSATAASTDRSPPSVPGVPSRAGLSWQVDPSASSGRPGDTGGGSASVAFEGARSGGPPPVPGSGPGKGPGNGPATEDPADPAAPTERCSAEQAALRYLAAYQAQIAHKKRTT